MKNILWLSHMIPYPPKGGNLQRSYNLIRELSRYHNVTVVAFNQSKILDSDKRISEAIEHFSSFCTFKYVLNVPSEAGFFARMALLFTSLLPWKTYTVSWLSSKKFKNAVSDVVRAQSFDIIYADTISLAPYIIDKANYPKVLNHHNIESQMLLRRAHNEKSLLKKAYFYWEGVKLQRYEKKICGSLNLNVTCSDIDSFRLAEIAGALKIVNIPNGVDLEYFRPSPNIAIKPKSLVFAGGLTWYPNLDAMTFFLKSVWPQLVREIPGISLTVIGRSPPHWMIELQEKYPTLRVTGFVDDVRPYLTEAEIYICPIKDGGGTKLKVLDCLAMGKPLVADQIACEGIDVLNGETVLFASSPAEYIKQIKLLLEDKALAQKIAYNGQKLVERSYSFTCIGKKLSDELDLLTASN